jgi:hypothetical protein
MSAAIPEDVGDPKQGPLAEDRVQVLRLPPTAHVLLQVRLEEPLTNPGMM